MEFCRLVWSFIPKEIDSTKTCLTNAGELIDGLDEIFGICIIVIRPLVSR